VDGNLRKPVPPVAWEVLLITLLAAWRAWCHPFALLWRDWFFLLCLFWIFTALASRKRAWPYVAGALMGGLLVIYGLGQLPLTFAVLGLGR
jgi:hypothetical protein